MANALICKVCDGTEFHIEDGFYYCSECLTQTQELREQVFEFQETFANIRVTKRKIHKDKSLSQTNQQKLTSWETYNYILAGLVKELIQLGANNELKDVSYNLWLKYLIQLEIMTSKSEDEPKLGAVYRKWDAEIIFKKRYEKKKRKRSTSTRSVAASSEGDDIRALNRERAKQRRALINVEYEQFSSTHPSSDQSVHNKTLSSISTDSDFKEKPGVIKFSNAAIKELRKTMSMAHMAEHALDVENKLKCHRINKSLVSSNYVMGPLKLTRNKLYAIIYISMLLTREKFQLSDIVRFCREGHLSFWDYKHLFPDIDAKIDDKLYHTGNNALFTYNFIRKSACLFYKLMKLKPTDLTPNLVDLCQRYCNELNLPDQIFRMASHFINETKPKLLIKKSTSLIPNYEGRVMAFILYSLKVLLSIDDVTERHLSKFANFINKKNPEPKMFVWDEWYNNIEYRKVLLKNLHFPTKYNLEPDCINMPDLFLKYNEYRKPLLEPNDNIAHSVNIAKKLLNDLLLFQDPTNTQTHIQFKQSLTPTKSYVETILKSELYEVAGYSLKTGVLKDFTQDSVEYLIDYKPYLDTGNCKIKYKTAHTNEKIRKMRCTDTEEETKEYQQIFDKKWRNAFKKHKLERIHFDLLLDKVLNKHITNMASPVRIEDHPKTHLNLSTVTSKRKPLRDSKGKFCSAKTPDRKDASEFKPSRIRGKWFVSASRKNPLLEEHKYNPSLLTQVMKDAANKESIKKKEKRNLDSEQTRKTGNDADEYNLHYVPRFEYWVNVKNCLAMSSREWIVFEKTLPHNFQWLLAECARTVEQLPKDLFIEFVNVELYVNYIYLKNVPIMEKDHDNYSELTKLIAIAEKHW